MVEYRKQILKIKTTGIFQSHTIKAKLKNKISHMVY